MKSAILLFFLALISYKASSQAKPILVFDLVNGTIDSIQPIAFDPNMDNASTAHSFGYFNSTVALLEQTPPLENTFPETDFTLKRPASLDYDVEDYPIRTTIKIFHIDDGNLNGNCSGSLISRRHVLTAAHCFVDLGTNNLNKDSLVVFPAFDNGEQNFTFNSSAVTKVYFFKNWSTNGDDMAVLELAEPIGDDTGWLSIGFNNIDSELSEGIFYKFTYPAWSIFEADSNAYNGDSLFYNYGVVDNIGSTHMSINGTFGEPGESGSSIIKVVNNEMYTTYGVLSYATNLRHSKINDWQYYAIENIIQDDLILSLPPIQAESVVIYPNPVARTIFIKSETSSEPLELTLFDSLGRTVLKTDGSRGSTGIDVSFLSSGIYFLKIWTAAGVVTKKIIKE